MESRQQEAYVDRSELARSQAKALADNHESKTEVKRRAGHEFSRTSRAKLVFVG